MRNQRHPISSIDLLRAAEPVLKWPGGKRQLLHEIRRFYPPLFGAYIEPFLGSGAVFFDLSRLQFLAERRVVLADSNVDLIGCYTALRDNIDGVVRALKRLVSERCRGDVKQHYYTVRDERFNPIRRRLLGTASLGPACYTPGLAAMLIYLNRTGFNGLFRLNAHAMFNVPIGRYANPIICNEAKLRRAAAAFRRADTVLVRDDFQVVLENAKEGDLVYLDPPYAPVSKTAGFTSYTAGRFLLEDQLRLQRVVIELARRGCSVILSNSSTPATRDLYEENAEVHSVGLKTHKVLARRSINSQATGRGEIHEYLVSNVKPRFEEETHAR
jgi:DNA adenine methylase